MLAQFAQVMGIKAAQQEMQGNEEMRNLFAGGANFDDPEFQRRGYAANPKQFQELLGKRATTQKTEIEALTNEIKLRRDALSDVNTPEDYLKWHESNHQGRVGSFFKSIGVNPSRESIIAQLNQPGGLAKLKQASSLGATELEKKLMDAERAIKVANINAAPGLRQASVAEQRLAMEQGQLKAITDILGGGSGSTPTPVVTGGGGGGGVVSPVAPPVTGAPVAPPAAGGQINALAPTPTPPVNALVNPPVDQTGALTVAPRVEQIKQQITQLAKLGGNPKAQQVIDNLVKEYNVLNPTQKIAQDASGAFITVDERAGVSRPVLGQDGKPVMGKLPYETAFGGEVGKAQAARNEKVVTQAQAAPDSIRKIDDTIAILRQGDATTGLGAELRTNVDRARALLANDVKAGKRVSDTQILDALLGSDVFPMIQSLGIGARGLDTPAERDYLRQVMTGTIQMDRDALIRLSEIRRNMEVRAIQKYNTQLEKGELNKYFETQGLKPEKIEVPTVAGGANSNTVSVGGVTYTFPDAAAAAKFKKEAGIK